MVLPFQHTKNASTAIASMNGASTKRVSLGTSSGLTTAAIPATDKMLKILLPMMLPIAISG